MRTVSDGPDEEINKGEKNYFYFCSRGVSVVMFLMVGAKTLSLKVKRTLCRKSRDNVTLHKTCDVSQNLQVLSFRFCTAQMTSINIFELQ